MRRRLSLAAVYLLVLFTGLPGLAFAHELQPGSLELQQLTSDRYEVIWRAPIYYGKPHPAKLQLPEDWQHGRYIQPSDSCRILHYIGGLWRWRLVRSMAV